MRSHSRRHAIVLLLAASLGACAADPVPSDVPTRTFDPCAPLAVRIAPEASPAQRDAIATAVGLWSDVLGTRMIDAASADEDALAIRFEGAAPAFHGIYLDDDGAIVINTALADADARAIVIAHELGHAFGLGHVAPGARASLMNPGNLSIGPAAAEADELAARWTSCQAIDTDAFGAPTTFVVN